jgi:hypothetical protein
MAQKSVKEQPMVSPSGVNVRQHVIRATREAAQAENVSVNADQLAFVSEPGAMFVNAPIAGIEKVDVAALVSGQPVFDDTPIMYWQLSGPAFDNNGAIAAGHYIVVADSKRGAVSLRTVDGTTVAGGDLGIEIIPHLKTGPGVALFGVSVSGGVDKFKVSKNKVEFCGHVSVSVGPASLSVSGCITIT